MTVTVLCCAGTVEPEHNNEYGRTRYACSACGLDLQMKDEKLAHVFGKIEAANVTLEVPLSMLCAAPNRPGAMR